MAPEPSRSASATADMVAAKRRSALYGLDPANREIPHLGGPSPSADALARLSDPVLDRLLSQITDSSLAVVMSDRDGRLTRREAPRTTTLSAMDQRSLDIGFSLAEPDVGTNGVGTALETRKPAVVVGEDHFLQCFQDFTCANAPIVQPVTGRVEGTVGVVCPVDDTSPLLLSTAVQLASHIGELLLERATPEERFLLEQFLVRRKSARNAIATIGHEVLIATPPAQRYLGDLDHAELWGKVAAALHRGGSADIELERTAAPPILLRCQPLHRGGRLEGAAVQFVTDRPSTDRGRRHRNREQLGSLVGTSQPWRSVVRDALNAAQLSEPLLIVGERGSGRGAVAEAVANHAGGATFRKVDVIDSADLLVEGSREWLSGVSSALDREATVVLRRVDELPDHVAGALAKVVAGSGPARLIATTQTDSSDQPGLARLLGRLDVLRVEIPPLRVRRDDITPLAQHFATMLGRPPLGRQIVNTLARQSWPGNVAELGQAIRSAHARARTEPITVQHLPRHLRRDRARTPLHGLRQQEAEAIVAAINSTTTRAEAAKQLGISRATLYRRIEAYGLDLEG